MLAPWEYSAFIHIAFEPKQPFTQYGGESVEQVGVEIWTRDFADAPFHLTESFTGPKFAAIFTAINRADFIAGERTEVRDQHNYAGEIVAALKNGEW